MNAILVQVLSKLRMRLLLPVLMMIPAASVVAKTADDYFHGAAHRFIEGKIQEASVEAEEGLRLHPGDDRLRRLAAHLEKMKDRQRNPQGDGQGSGEKNKDKSQKPQDGDRDDKEGKESDKGDGESDNENPGKQPEPRGDEPGEEEKRDGTGRPLPGRMSEEEAKRLLNSFADDEKKEQAERRRMVRPRPGTEQDW